MPSSPLTVDALGTSTLDSTGTYTPVTLGAAATVIVTRDAGTPVGDAVVVTLSGLSLAVGATFISENGATLNFDSSLGVGVGSSISIGASGTVGLAAGIGLNVGQSISFSGPDATLDVAAGGLTLPIGGAITGFSASDTVDFAGVAQATSADYVNGSLVLYNGTSVVDSLAITGTFGASTLTIQADGNGGYNVGDNVGAVTYRESGSSSQYVVGVTSVGVSQIFPVVSNGDGAISAAENTTVGFSDGTAVMDPNGTAADIARLYQGVLGRAPDQAGLVAWNQLVTLGEINLQGVANAFVSSPEFALKYGSLTNTQFVDQLYANTNQTLDTTAQGDITALDGGAARSAIAVSVTSSVTDVLANQSTFGDSSAAEVYRIFEGGLGRAPGDSGYAAFLPLVQGGLTPEAMGNIVIGSPEFQEKYGSPSASQFISQVFENALGRPADADAQTYFQAQLAAGLTRADLLVGIADSPEAKLLTASVTHDGYVSLAHS